MFAAVAIGSGFWGILIAVLIVLGIVYFIRHL